MGVTYENWQLFPYKVQGRDLRQLLAKPPENINNLASSLSSQARPWLPNRGLSNYERLPKALFILYTSPWCASEVEPFEFEKVADFLPAWRKVTVWDCGGVQLALISFR